MRRILRGTLYVLVTVLVLAAIAFGLLQTRPGRDAVAGLVARLASQPGMTVTIGRIDGLIPVAMEVHDLTVADAAGPWLTIDRARLDWKIMDLLSRRFRLSAVEADTMRLTRLPEPAAPAPAAETQSGPIIPELPVTVALDRFAIDRIVVGEAIAGEQVTLTVSGAAELRPERATATLTAQRIDGTQGSLDLALVFAPRENRLEARVAASEPTGRLADRLLGRDDHRALALTVTGDGPLDQWKGRIQASLGADAGADIAVEIAGADPYRVSLAGTVRAAPLLPPAWAAPLTDGIRLAATIAVSSGAILVESFDADAAGVALAARGRLEDESISGVVDATVVDLTPLGRPLGVGLAGAVVAKATVTGTLSAPVVQLGIDAQEMAIADLRADAAAMRLQLRPDATGIAVAGDGTLAAPRAGDGAPPAGDVTWSAAGRVGKDGKVAIERATVAAENLSATVAGNVDPAGPVAGRVAAEIGAAWLAAFGSPVQGRVRLSGEVAGDMAGGTVDAKLAGALIEPKGEPAVTALLGDRLDLAVTASRAADGTIRATELDAKGAHVALDGAATLGADMSVDARLGLRLTNLGVLADPLGTPIAGNVALTATAKGSLDRPTVQLQVTGGEVAVAGKRWRNVQATVDGGRDGDGFSARISARADAEGVPVTLALKAAHDGDDRLTIEDVTATAADARATGRATIVGTRPTQASGMLEIPDIGRLASLLGERAAGRISAEARLEPTGRGMRLTGKLTGRGLAAADLAIGSAEATATIDDPWERPRGRVRLRGDRITAAGQAIDFVALDLDGSPAGGIAAHLTASAPQPRPLAVDLNARLVLEANAMAATVERGHVQVAEQRIQLGAPLRLRWTGATLTADGVDLRLDQGRLAGDGSWSSAGATAALTLEQLPLAAAGRLAGIRGMQGRLDGRLTLDTRAQRPTAALALTGAGIRWRGTPRNLPPLAFALDGTWSNGRVRATAALRDVPDATLTLAAEGPLVLAGRPISFAVPPDGAISARADGSTDLARIAAYLPLEGMRLAGRLQVALEVGGTVATPRPGGRATLTEARVEEGGSGLVLAGLNAAVVGDGREFRLESLTATDGDSGRIEASGNARRSSDGWRADAAVVLRRFRVLASDLGRATASGRLEASAAPGGARLAGTLTVDEGDIALPSRPPAVARPIPVVEINRPDGRDIEPAPSAPAMVIALDLKVDIPGRLFVRGRGLDSEWRGSLTVRGTADAPQVFGSISTVRGRYDLIGRRFTVERGVISFDGDPAAASLDLLATATAGQLRATVTVTGSVAAPQLTLGSDPPLPQDEVLAQVLFGKSTAQMTPGQAVQLAQAAAELTGIGGGAGLVDRVRRSLGLDALDVGGESGTSVTLGKYVADGVFLKVNPNPGENASAVGVEIEVLPNVTVDAGVGGEGTNVGIKYRFDY